MKDYEQHYNCRIYSPTKSHTTVPSFIRDTSGMVGFTSLYNVTEADAQAIVAAGTTATYKGVVGGERLWLDIDSYEAADAVEERLKEMGYGYIAYDSGGRGVHFGINRAAVPSHLLPAQDKAWVQAHFPEADLSIYTHLHLFRLPGTIHETHGREKTLVDTVEGKTLYLPRLEKKDVKLNILASSSSGYNVSIFDCTRVMANSIPTVSGNRHPTLVKLCYALKDDAGVDANIARWWVGEVNKLSEEPKEDEQLDQIVGSIYGA